MNEQIVITYGDNGIEIGCTFLDSKKKPVDVTGKVIDVNIVDPQSNRLSMEAYILNPTGGSVAIILDSELTSVEGLWKTYWSCYDDDGYVTAQEAIYYFVLPMYGGA